MNTGILAACLPALRPLFAFLLETATAIKTSGLRGRSAGSGGIQGRYYIHEDDVKLGSMPSRSTIISKQGYGVTVIGGLPGDDDRRIYRQPSSTSSGPMSKLEASIGENDSGSEENILPLQVHSRVHMPKDRNRTGRGIMRTTEVMISR
jgi:hypothetical protein